MTRIETTPEIIKCIPLDATFKADLLRRYPDQMESAEKRVIDDVMWDIYERYFQIHLALNRAQELESLKAGDPKATTALDHHFEANMRRKTHDEMQSVLLKLIDEAAMQQVRDSITAAR